MIIMLQFSLTLYSGLRRHCVQYIVIANSKEESEQQSSKSTSPDQFNSQKNVDEIRDWFAIDPRLCRDC